MTDNVVGTALGYPETDLPIAAGVSNYRSGRDAESSFDAGRKTLDHQDNGAHADSRTQGAISIDDLTKDVKHLGLDSPEVLSPASFVSASENYFETKPEMQSKHRPSAEEIVERANYNSANTTYHNKMAPGASD